MLKAFMYITQFDLKIDLILSLPCIKSHNLHKARMLITF